MKLISLIIILYLAICFNGCKTITTHHGVCNKSQEEIFKHFIDLVMTNGFLNVVEDPKNGVVIASSSSIKEELYIGSESILGAALNFDRMQTKSEAKERTYFWMLKIENNKIKIALKLNTVTYDKDGQESYFDNSTNDDVEMYWNVKNGMENFCGGLFIEDVTDAPKTLPLKKGTNRTSKNSR